MTMSTTAVGQNSSKPSSRYEAQRPLMFQVPVMSPPQAENSHDTGPASRKRTMNVVKCSISADTTPPLKVLSTSTQLSPSSHETTASWPSPGEPSTGSASVTGIRNSRPSG